jgi:hypothetical protein
MPSSSSTPSRTISSSQNSSNRQCRCSGTKLLTRNCIRCDGQGFYMSLCPGQACVARRVAGGGYDAYSCWNCNSTGYYNITCPQCWGKRVIVTKCKYCVWSKSIVASAQTKFSNLYPDDILGERYQRRCTWTCAFYILYCDIMCRIICRERMEGKNRILVLSACGNA